MRKMDFGRDQTLRRWHLSGGQLQVPKTPVERLMLVIKLRKLKADYYRRQEEHRE